MLTDGELVWEDAIRGFDPKRSKALPTPLADVFEEEPLHLNLSWARDEQDLDSTNSRFRNEVLKLAATLRGISIDDMAGEEVRQHRRTKLVAWSAVVALVTLLAASVVAGWIAARQRDEAVRERNTATSRQLIAESARVREESPQLSLLLAVESQRVAARNQDAQLPEVETNLFALLQSVGGMPLAGHSTQIRKTGFGPQGRWVISSSSDSLRVWEVCDADGTIRPLASLIGQSEHVVAVSPDGGLLGTVSRDKTHVWRLGGQPLVETRMDLPGASDYLAFGPKGLWLAGAEGGRVRLWRIADLALGAPPLVLLEEPAGVITGLFFADGRSRLFARVDQGYLAYWDLESSQIPRRHTIAFDELDPRASLEISPNGDWIAAIDDSKAMLVHLRTESKAVFPLQMPWARGGIAFTQDNRWFAFHSGGREVVVQRLMRSGQTSHWKTFSHPSDVNTMTFSSDASRLFTGAADGGVRIWRLDGKDTANQALMLHGHSSAIRAVALSPDDRWLATGSRDDTIRVWDLQAPEPGAASRVFCGLESVWAGESSGVDYVAFSPNGRWLLGRAYEARLRVWDLWTGISGRLPLMAKISRDEGAPEDLAGPWSVLTVRGSRASIGFVEGTAKTAADTLFVRPVEALNAAGPNGRWRIERTSGGPVRICRAEASRSCRSLGNDLHWIQFGAAGNWLLVSSSTGAKFSASLYNLRNLIEAEPFPVDLDPWSRGHFDPTGQWLVAPHSEALWYLGSKKPLRRLLAGHIDPVNDLAFSTGSRRLATSSSDAILLWSLTSQESEPVRIDTRDTSIFEARRAPAVSFSADGRWLGVYSTGQVYLWPLEIEKILALAEETAGRSLSSAERQKHIAGE